MAAEPVLRRPRRRFRAVEVLAETGRTEKNPGGPGVAALRSRGAERGFLRAEMPAAVVTAPVPATYGRAV